MGQFGSPPGLNMALSRMKSEPGRHAGTALTLLRPQLVSTTHEPTLVLSAELWLSCAEEIQDLELQLAQHMTIVLPGMGGKLLAGGAAWLSAAMLCHAVVWVPDSTFRVIQIVL